MALGETLKLGYLEFAASRGPSPTLTNAPVVEDTQAFGGTLKFNVTDTAKGAASCGYAKDEAPIQPLEWTHIPVREVRKEGNMRYQVSQAALPHHKDNKIHLVRTTRIEPRPSSRSSSKPSSRPSSRQPGPRSQADGTEEIVVSEVDFHRCGNRLTLLRRCQLPKLPPSSENAKDEMELSFKSAFLKRCLSQDGPIVDPWRDYGNPEEIRRRNSINCEGDLVLNQVWVASPRHQVEQESLMQAEVDDLEQTLTPRTSARRDSRTRASSMGPIPSRSCRGDQTDKQETRHPSRKNSRRPPPHRSQRRSRSQGVTATEALETTSPLAFGRDGSQGRRHSSGCPKPSSGRESSVNAKPKEYVNRIQEISPDDDEEPVRECVGSLAIQQAIREQRRFSTKMDVKDNVKIQALWLWLDPLTGEVSIYPRAAATRLEGAYVNNRVNVPLAGLGSNLEDSIVHLGRKGTDEYPVQRSLQGGQMDVRRLQIPTDASEVCINTKYESGWHIVDVAEPGETEQRTLVLQGTETVRPPTPPLPPVNPDRRASFSVIKPWWFEEA